MSDINFDTVTVKATKLTEAAKSRLRRRRAAFAKADDAGKRVLIAKDVIDQIAAERLVPTQGSFFHFAGTGRLKYDRLKYDTCKACAVGSLFLGVCDITKRPTTYSPGFKDTMWAALAEYFSAHQLACIEAAFEGTCSVNYARARPNGSWDYVAGSDNPDEAPKFSAAEKVVIDAAIAWHAAQKDYEPHELLENIMLNIIANKGEFVP